MLRFCTRIHCSYFMTRTMSTTSITASSLPTIESLQLQIQQLQLTLATLTTTASTSTTTSTINHTPTLTPTDTPLSKKKLFRKLKSLGAKLGPLPPQLANAPKRHVAFLFSCKLSTVHANFSEIVAFVSEISSQLKKKYFLPM